MLNQIGKFSNHISGIIWIYNLSIFRIYGHSSYKTTVHQLYSSCLSLLGFQLFVCSSSKTETVINKWLDKAVEIFYFNVGFATVHGNRTTK